ncbi:MAG TPA: phage terminase large subunit [Chitinophagaceae bacterium]|nr:phage terminase large subunit [Chitinophagaceae bacterium]HRA71196.1 phage terminase large subunit [Flavobacterium sp.]
MGLESLGYTQEQLALLSDEELVKLSELIEAKEEDERLEKATDRFLDFAEYISPEHNYSGFYKVYYTILGMFADGKINRLMVSVPPQTGKSEGSTRKLPAFLFGKNPNIKMAIGSYSSDLSKDFNSDIQKIIDSPEYHKIFPNTMLSGSPYDKDGIKGFSRTREQFEILKKKGVLYSLGRGGGLTGKTIDLAILDDLYKNYEEANSPIVREEAINFYKSVIRTRNPKQELIVFTRWHEEDLIGFIESKETVVTINSLIDIDNIPPRAWVKINFEALKDSEPTDIDPRKYGEPLAPEKHSKERLEEEKKLDKENFECLYQGNPFSKEGLMYGEFSTYPSLPPLRIIKCETDTADKGTDFFCAVVYGLPLDWNDDSVYVLDIMYTKEPMEVTEPMYINLLNRWRVNEADIESNNGGRGFSRAIESKVNAVINQKYQTSNKEARIFSNRAKVNRDILFPVGWEHSFDKFHSHLTKFKKFFKANKTDETADVLTSIIERKDDGFRVEDIEIDND